MYPLRPVSTPLHLFSRTAYLTSPCVCHSPAQRGVQEWKARISIRSRAPSTVASATPSEAPAQPPAETEVDAPSLTPYLCYACHTTLTSRSARPVPSPWGPTAQSPVVSLPVWTEARLSSAKGDSEETAHSHGEIMQTRRVGEDEMKGMVAEFLLDE